MIATFSYLVATNQFLPPVKNLTLYPCVSWCTRVCAAARDSTARVRGQLKAITPRLPQETNNAGKMLRSTYKAIFIGV